MKRIHLLLTTVLAGLILAACGTSTPIPKPDPEEEKEPDPIEEQEPVVPSVRILSPALDGALVDEMYLFTVLATGLEGESVTFSWSVDTEAPVQQAAEVSGGSAVTLFSYAFTEERDYEVSVVVEDEDSEELASSSQTITVTIPVPESRHNLSDPVAYDAGPSPHSVTVAHLDDDDHPDIIVTISGDDLVAILWGQGLDQESEPSLLFTGDSPKHAVVEDFDGDGCMDIAVAIEGGGTELDPQGMVEVFLSTGPSCGSFGLAVQYEACGRPHHLAVGAFNAEGNFDLVVACWNRNEIAILPGLGDGTFDSPRLVDSGGASPHAVVVADFNNDGRDDIAVAVLGDNAAAVLLADVGNYALGAPDLYSTGGAPHSIKAADLNGDGLSDLVTANQDTGDVSVLMNRQDSFRSSVEYDVGDTPKDVAVGDIDGDGYPDLVVVNTAGNHPDGEEPTDITVLFGRRNGTFEDRETIALDLTPFSVAIADLNGDALNDVVTANWGSNDVKVLYGRKRPTQDTTSLHP